MFANREGLFHAYPADVGLGESRKNKLLQVNVLYRLYEEFVDGMWQDCFSENLEITGYHVLEKCDHSLNEMTIESLKAALGWDGRDPFWLQDNSAALSQHPVQVRLGYEEHNGKQSLKVQFLNPHGSQRGGVTKADGDARRAINNRLGAKFRALAGGTPANPPKPAGKPNTSKPAATAAATPAATTTPAVAHTAPAAAPSATAVPATSASPASAAPAEAIPPATMQQAWDEFVKNSPLSPGGVLDQAGVEREWFRVLGLLFPGRRVEQLSDADWGVVLVRGPGMMLPF